MIDPAIFLDPPALAVAVLLGAFAVTLGIFRHERPTEIALQAGGVALAWAALRWTQLVGGDEALGTALFVGIGAALWTMGAERVRGRTRESRAA